MEYYVIGPDGSKYGPADVATLKQWVSENRVTPHTELEEFATGQKVGAHQIEGLFQTPIEAPPLPGGTSYATMYENPPLPGHYPRMGPYYSDSTSELTWSFVLFGLGAFFCVLSPIFCSFGLVQANKAIAKGNPSGRIARILNLVLLILGSCVLLFYIAAIVIALASGLH